MIEAVEVVVRQPGYPDRVVRLNPGSTSLGRAEDNDIVLSDVGVSRRHAVIKLTDTEVVVEDLGSGNGSYYNGYRIKSQAISNNEEVVLDPFILQFRVRGEVKTQQPEVPTTAARLEVVVGTGMAGSSYPITARGLTIGRSEDRDVVIPDPAASRHHVTVLAVGDSHSLRDEGSANGVFVNSVRVRECLLNDGDMIRIGNTEMRFVTFGAASLASATQLQEGGWDKLPPPTWQAGASKPRRTGWITVVAGGLLAAIGLFTVVGVIAALLIALYTGALELPGRAPAAAAPSWALQLPAGLEAAAVDTLFKEGIEAMRANNDKLALQNFYRVLLADHGNPSAKKFAYAAGEHLVVGSLQSEFEAARSQRAKREAKRDKLLAKLKNRKTAAKAKATLKDKFADDPLVRKKLKLPDSDALKSTKKALISGAEHLAAQRYRKAARSYEKVLGAADDDEMRKTAMAGLRTAQRELARQAQASWSEGVLAEADGKLAKARVAFHNVTQLDADNPSAKVHLAKIGE